MRISILSLALFIASLSFGQRLTDTIDANNFKQTLLEKALFDRINQYRKTLFLNPLVFNVKVYDAAEDHCAYLVKTKTLGHEQDVPGKKTVYDRVRKYTGVKKFSVAENVARTVILKPALNYDAEGKTSMKTAYTYKQAADYMFNAWKQSDFHRQNMSSDKYVVSAIALKFDPKDYSLTAVQVFARFGA